MGCSHNAARSALEDLEHSGLVVHRQAGEANLYSLDADNVLFTDILSSAFLVEAGFSQRWRGVISNWMGDEPLLDSSLRQRRKR